MAGPCWRGSKRGSQDAIWQLESQLLARVGIYIRVYLPSTSIEGAAQATRPDLPDLLDLLDVLDVLVDLVLGCQQGRGMPSSLASWMP